MTRLKLIPRRLGIIIIVGVSMVVLMLLVDLPRILWTGKSDPMVWEKVADWGERVWK